MIYISVIVTLILIIRFMEMMIMCAAIEYDRRKSREYRLKQDLINSEIWSLEDTIREKNHIIYSLER